MTLIDQKSEADNQGQHGEERPVDTRPYLCVPYWNTPRFPGDKADTGETRPLPAVGVISWDCPGIHASPYKPGNNLDVKVDVRNSGPGNATALATVVVYWVDPTVGFAKPFFFGATTVAVAPRGGFVTSSTLSATIPLTAPDHICLLAVVTHSLDKAKPTCDPVGDRHWAQRNVIAVSAAPSVPLIFPFIAANPFAAETRFRLHVRVLEKDALGLVALRFKAEPSKLRPRIQLADERGELAMERERDAYVDVALGPYGARRYTVVLQLDHELPPHDLAAVEAALYLHQDRERPVGSLGIVLTGEDIDI
jgi:hypothetical protein